MAGRRGVVFKGVKIYFGGGGSISFLWEGVYNYILYIFGCFWGRINNIFLEIKIFQIFYLFTVYQLFLGDGEKRGGEGRRRGKGRESLLRMD